MAQKEEKKDRWLPLEANPDVMNKYVTNLGMETAFQFHDVFGLDPDLLGMIPSPCISLLLLFPINEKYTQYEEEEEARIKREGQIVSPQVFFMKQYVGNACGTVGLLHSLGNCTNYLTFSRLFLARRRTRAGHETNLWQELTKAPPAHEEGYLKDFFHKTKDMSPEERGKYLEEDESISEAHEASAQEGDTAPPAPDEEVKLHFISLVHKDGHLYELDGRKPFPINHGPTTPDTFLQDAARVCQGFMARDPSELHFTVVALAAAQ